MNIENYSWLKNNSPLRIDKDIQQSYFVNDLGWRSNDQKMWTQPIENSVVLLGCSQSFGWGLPYTSTMAYYIEQSLQRQVVNLSKPGTSVDWIWKMLIDIRKRVKPWAVVVNWPNPFRYYEWHTGKHGLLTFDIDGRDQELYDFYLKNADYKKNLTDCILESSRLMWSGHTKWVELTWARGFSNIHMIDAVDTAEDNSHWGSQTHQLAADYVINHLTDVL